VPTLDEQGAQHPAPARVPGAARKNACIWRTWGQPGECGTQREQLRKPSEDTFSFDKNIWDGGGSHRRSRAVSTAIFDGRRDGNAAATRPRAGEVFRGESTVAPCPLKTVQWVIGHTQHPPG
jgi:hypothetical protein